MSILLNKVPTIYTGDQLERSRYIKKFLELQTDNLTYLYNCFPEKFQRRFTLDEWIKFAFKQTSTNGLQQYRL
jgi:hypothetical protein